MQPARMPVTGRWATASSVSLIVVFQPAKSVRWTRSHVPVWAVQGFCTGVNCAGTL